MISGVDYDEPQMFTCIGGPWNGREILLGDDEATMVFKLRRKRGRYTTRRLDDKRLARPGTVTVCHWQSVPLQVAS